MLFIALLLSLNVAYGQRFYATSNAKAVVVGSYVQVDFVLENLDGKEFRPPNFKGFDVVSGPSTSTSTSITNGNMSKTFKVSYGLQPKVVGTFTIGSATVSVSGKTMKTKPFSLKVVKGSDKTVAADKQVYVKAVLSDTTAYVGQQLLLNYVLYTTLDVKQFDVRTEGDFDGFFTEQLRLGKINFTREIIDGVEYFTRPLWKAALFPQQTGTYEIPETMVELGIAKPGARRSFFSSFQVTPKLVRAEAIKVQVKGLPPTTEPYTGAVGRYRMSASTTKKTLTTDDAIEVRVEILGNGDAKTVTAPRWVLPEGLEMYDPNVLDDQIKPTNNGLNHSKIFEYLIVAKRPGRYNIQPTFTYFDTDKNDYVTLRKNLGMVTVVQGSNKTPQIAAVERQPLAGIFATTTLVQPSQSFYNSWPHLLGLALCFLSGLGLFVYSNYLKKSGQLDPALLRRDKAKEVAQNQLKQSKVFLDKEDSKGFHQEMITALKTYVTDKYNIPALHIKKSELLQKLTGTNMTTSDIETFKTILDRSEIAMYAPGLTTEMVVTYDKAIDLITGLE